MCYLVILLFGHCSQYSILTRLVRSTQSYVFPIHLSEEIIPAAVFYATITPLVAWFVIKKTIIEPMNAEQQKRKIEKVREVNQKR